MLYYLGAAVLAGAAAVCGEIFREVHRFRVTHYEIESPLFPVNMQEKRIVFLSDLHNHVYGENHAKLVHAIRAQKPDLILVTGDMLVGRKKYCFEPAVALMRQLPEIAPVYFVNGNHEQRMKEREEEFGDSYRIYHKELLDAGIHYLENTSEALEWDGMKVQIHGLELPMECYDRPGNYVLKKSQIEERLGKAEKGVYHIMLAHHPGYADVCRRWGAKLILSGHLHGGVVRIPGLGGVISPQFRLFPKYSGSLYKEKDASIVVSKGLGTHTLNVRLLNPAELIVLHLKS